MRTIVDQSDEIIPGAAHLGDAALTIALDRTRATRLPLALRPVLAGRRRCLQAPLRFRRGLLRGAPHLLEVHADPCGTGLHLGWLLAREDHGTARALLGGAAELVLRPADRVDAGVEGERERLAMTRAFNDLVFLPTLDVVVAAVEGRPVRRRPR